MPEALKSIRRVLDEAYLEGGFRVLSDFAKREMVNVAMAASLGLITTRFGHNEYGRTWRLTSKGLRWLNEETT